MRRPRLILGAILVMYAGLAMGYSLVNPIYEATDELRHVRFVRHIATYGNLPEQTLEGPRAQSHHPPLYYALGALTSFWVNVDQDVYYEPTTNPFWGYRYWEVGNDNKNQYLHGDDEQFPFTGIALAVHVIRWCSVILGGLVVWLTWCLGSLIWGDDSPIALGAAALVAFTPQFLYLSGAVGNDVAAGLAGSAVLLGSLLIASEEVTDRRAAGLGLLYGLALMVKSNLAVTLLVLELAVLIGIMRARHADDRWQKPFVGFLRANLVLLATAAAVAGWWFVRNQILYGEPTGFERVTELWGVRDPQESWALAVSELPYFWTSLWGRFGYGQVPMPDWCYQALGGVALMAGAGWVVRIVRRWRYADTVARGQTIGLALLIVTVGLIFGVVFAYLLVSPAGPMGRFFFPALSAFALLLVAGLTGWFHRRWEALLAGLVGAGMAVLALWTLGNVLHPAFARPEPLTAEEQGQLPNAMSYQLGQVARLVGHEVVPRQVYPGDVVDVTLYWEALLPTADNLTVFVHMLDESDIVVAQRDTYPGLGRYPTSVWKAGVVFADRYRVHIPPTVMTQVSEEGPAGNLVTIQVGLYEQNGDRLQGPDGGDVIGLGELTIRPQPGSEYPNQIWANLDNQAALVGYILDEQVVRPGDTIRVDLYWRALRKMDENYSVFVQVLEAPDQIKGKGGAWPNDGRSPTLAWQEGDLVVDSQQVTVKPDTEPGQYQLVVGMAGSEGSLPIVADDGHWLSQWVVLGHVRVEP